MFIRISLRRPSVEKMVNISEYTMTQLTKFGMVEIVCTTFL